MAYTICQLTSNFKLTNMDNALEALKKIVNNANSFKECEKINTSQASDLVSAMAYLGWNLKVENNNVCDIHLYDDCAKYSIKDIKVFNAIAPYVEAGSFINIEGEDGSLFSYQFDGEKCNEIDL